MSTIFTSKTGMCPKCHVIRNFRVNIERQETRSQDDAIKTMEISTTHCESCGSFILRESREVSEQSVGSE
jgi:hypothetical protein